MKALNIVRASVCVIAAIGLSLGQGIHDGMKAWEWFKFTFLALGSGAAALAAFLDTSFGKLWHKDGEPEVPSLTAQPKA
jgi:hypothetical protein